MRGIEVKIGDKFGKLTIIKKADPIIYPNSKQCRAFLCECDCGVRVVRPLQGLFAKGISSCGCYRHEMPSKKLLPVKIGKIYNQLTIIKEVNREDNKRMVLCECSCGNRKNFNYEYVRRSNTKSCGCREKGNFKHRMSRTKFYRTFVNINRRCTDISGNRWRRYGGRGIKNLWKTFEDFKKDMYRSYLKHVKKFGERDTSIDRIDNDGNYCKENCKWSTLSEQFNNTSVNVFLKFNGQNKTISQWVDKTGLPYNTIYNRLRRGWEIERTLTTPIYKNKRNKKYVERG